MAPGYEDRPVLAAVAEPRSKVLVVEDDPIQRRVVSRLLERWWFEPVEAADGGVAIALLGESGARFSAILLDMMLPVVDGIGVARVAVQLRPSPPIVACSAAFNDRMEGELRSLGVRDFLPKPYSVEALKDILGRLSSAAGESPETRASAG